MYCKLYPPQHRVVCTATNQIIYACMSTAGDQGRDVPAPMSIKNSYSNNSFSQDHSHHRSTMNGHTTYSPANISFAERLEHHLAVQEATL